MTYIQKKWNSAYNISESKDFVWRHVKAVLRSGGLIIAGKSVLDSIPEEIKLLLDDELLHI